MFIFGLFKKHFFLIAILKSRILYRRHVHGGGLVLCFMTRMEPYCCSSIYVVKYVVCCNILYVFNMTCHPQHTHRIKWDNVNIFVLWANQAAYDLDILNGPPACSIEIWRYYYYYFLPANGFCPPERAIVCDLGINPINLTERLLRNDQGSLRQDKILFISRWEVL